GDDAVELGNVFQADEALLDVASRPKHAAVPVSDFAKRQAGETLAALFDEQMEMAVHEVETLQIGRRWAWIAGLFPALELGEEPGIEESAPADGDAGAARQAQHLFGVGDAANVAVADDRNVLNGFGDGAD